MAKPKTTKSPARGVKQVEAYLAAVPEPAHATLLTLRETIRSAAPPEAIEEMGYGVPSFRSKDRLAGYAAGKEFCSYYPMSGYVITALHDDLKGYTTSKGAIRFPINQPLPPSLVQKLIQTRLDDIERKIERKKQPGKREG
jgi:uncharacterized protein YdhG (YjbR/CyaY superfamily)